MVQRADIGHEPTLVGHPSHRNMWRRTDWLHLVASDTLTFQSSDADIDVDSRPLTNRKTHFIRRAGTHDAGWFSAHILTPDPWISIWGEVDSPQGVGRPSAPVRILVLEPSQVERADELPKLGEAVLRAMASDPQAHTISNARWYVMVAGDEERSYVVIECDSTLSLVDSMSLRGRLNDVREEYELTHGLDDRAGVVVINWS